MSKINSIIDTLKNLSDEELKVIQKVLGGPLTKVDNPDKVVKSKRKQRRKNEKINELVEVEPTAKVQDGARPRKISSSGGKKVVRSSNSPKHRGQGSSKGRPARTESVDLTSKRENKFYKHPAFNSNRDDIAIDKLLNKGKQPTERREEVSLVEADCNQCGDTWEVPASFIYRDDDGINFICETCQRKKRK